MNKKVTVIDSQLTIDDLCAMFHVQRQTIWNWRHQDTDPLPYIMIMGHERHNVRFRLSDVTYWAKRNEKEIDKDRIPENIQHCT